MGDGALGDRSGRLGHGTREEVGLAHTTRNRKGLLYRAKGE